MGEGRRRGARGPRRARTAEVTFAAAPGPEVRFGEIHVAGCSKAARWKAPGPRRRAPSPLEKQLRRRATFTHNSRYSPTEIDATRGRYEALGLFSQVRVRAVPRPGQPGIAGDVEGRGEAGQEERDPRGRRLRARQRAAGAPPAVHLHAPRLPRRPPHAAPACHARVRRVAVVLHARSRSGPAVLTDATFTQPDLLLRDLQARVTLGYDRNIEYAFDYEGPRGQVGLDYSFFRDRVSVGVSYNVQFLTFSNLANPNVFNDPIEARVFLGLHLNPYRLAWLAEQLTIDLRDSAIEAHRGAYASLS